MKKFPKAILSLFLLAITAPALATTIIPLTEEDLVAGADLVVQGRVLDVRSFWNKEKTTIFSEVRIQVEDSVVGKASPVVVVRTPGGQVGDVRIVLEGGPELKVGDRQLLLLKRHGDGVLRVQGGAQGQFRIHSDPQGNEMAVPLFSAGPDLPRSQALPAAQLKNRIRETARRVGHVNQK